MDTTEAIECRRDSSARRNATGVASSRVEALAAREAGDLSRCLLEAFEMGLKRLPYNN